MKNIKQNNIVLFIVYLYGNIHLSPIYILLYHCVTKRIKSFNDDNKDDDDSEDGDDDDTNIW